MTHINCLVCNSSDIAPLKGFESKFLVKCHNCGFVFTGKIPTQAELENYYTDYSYDREHYLSPLTIDSYNKLLDNFEKYRKNNLILDVGCGQGWFLEQAIKRGWKAFGTEFSKKAIEICTAKGINMKEGILDPKDFGDLKFDVIISTEVLEHINYPQKELKSIYSLLRDGGLFYLTTPNFNCYLRYYLKDKFNIIVYPEHLSYYTPKTLNLVLSNAGLKKDKLITKGISITRLEMGQGKKKGAVVAADTSDEKLRKVMNKNSFMRNVKKLANNILTISGLGLTLEGYYKK